MENNDLMNELLKELQKLQDSLKVVQASVDAVGTLGEGFMADKPREIRFFNRYHNGEIVVGLSKLGHSVIRYENELKEILGLNKKPEGTPSEQ